MSEIDLTLLTATLVGVGMGAVISKSWPFRLSASVNIALVAWLGRGIGILNGDQTTAGDYLNGLTYATAAVEIMVVIAWVVICSWLGAILRRFYHRSKSGDQ